MKIKHSSLLIALAAILFLSSCGKKFSDPTLEHIPNDVSGVVVLNLPALVQKADTKTLKDLPLFADIISKAKQDNLDWSIYMSNPAESGLDMEHNSYGFVYIDPQDLASTYFGVLMPIKDEPKWKKFITETGTPFEQRKNMMILGNSNATSSITVSNDKFLCMLSGSGITTTRITEILNLPKDKSIADNKSLVEFIQQNHDMGIWFTTDVIANAMKKSKWSDSFLMLAGLSTSNLSGNIFKGFYDFKNGEMEGGFDYKLNDSLGMMIYPMMKPKLEGDYSKWVPGNNLTALYTIAWNPKAFADFMHRGQLSLFFDRWAHNYGASFDQTMEALNGDIIVAVNQQSPGGTMMSPMYITVLVKLNKPDLFKKMFDGFVSTGQLSHEGETYTMKSLGDSPDKDIQFTIKDNILFVTNHPAEIAAIQGAGLADQDKLKADIYTKAASHFATVYYPSSSPFSLTGMLSAYFMTSDNTKEFSTIFNGESWSISDKNTTRTNMKMGDSNKNSLRAILEIVGKMRSESTSPLEKGGRDRAMELMREEEKNTNK